MKIGFRPPSDSKSFRTYINALAEYYQSVELPGSHASKLVRAARIARHIGFELTFHARYVDLYPGSPVPAIRKASLKLLREDLHIAAEIGASLVVVHAGNIAWTDYPPRGLSPAHDALLQAEAKMRREYLERARESLACLSRAASKLGVRLALENLAAPQEVPRSPEEMAFFMEVPNLEFCLDLGHAKIANCSTQDFVRFLKDKIGHLHVHTNDGRYDLHLPPSLGDLKELALDNAWSNNTILIELLPMRGIEECLRAYKEVAIGIRELTNRTSEKEV
ncbi:MAG: sugar phosphate isomerase/epimerase family protein [Candidatus Bathyarchaeia archaeon]